MDIIDRKLQKCIYCNSEELTVSDIIPYALTGAKITRKFVCRKHNKETNEKFESDVIEKWAVVRNHLGLRTREGNVIRYRGNLQIGNVKVENAKLTDIASLYEKQIFTATNEDGVKVKVGNVDKIKQISKEELEVFENNEVTVSCVLNLNELLASSKMKRTVAKIAYEWHCYKNDISGYDEEKYSNIIKYILYGIDSNIVEGVIDGYTYKLMEEYCEYGTHSIYEYIDVTGCCYVIFTFLNVIAYKIKVAENFTPNIGTTNHITMYRYNIDGTKNECCFGVIGLVNVISEPLENAIVKFGEFYKKNISLMLSTLVLTIYKAKQLVDKVEEDLEKYENGGIELAKFLNYEEYDRIFALLLLITLKNNEEKYDFMKGFNENIYKILSNDEIKTFNQEDKKHAIKKIIELHESGILINEIRTALEIFQHIYENEIKEIEKN